MKWLLIFAVVWTSVGFAKVPQSHSAIVSAKQLISLIKKHPDFKSDLCPQVATMKWIELFFMDHPIIQKYQFSKGCDVQGNLNIRKTPFPLKLEVRHLGEIKSVSGTASSIIVSSEDNKNILVKFFIKNGSLLGELKEKIMTFEGHYQLGLGIDGDSDSHGRGSIHILSYKTHSLNLNEPLEIH